MPPKKKATFTRRKGKDGEHSKPRDGRASKNSSVEPDLHQAARSAGSSMAPKASKREREAAQGARRRKEALARRAIEQAAAQQQQQQQQRGAAADARAASAEQSISSPMGGGAGGSAKEESPTGHSGTSGSAPSSGNPSDRKKQRPSGQEEEEDSAEEASEEEGPEEWVQRQPNFDSSDEEGAPKPPPPSQRSRALSATASSNPSWGSLQGDGEGLSKPPTAKVTPQRRVVLRGPLGQRRSDVGYLSDEEREWLIDTHLYNAYAYKLLLTKPKLRSGGRVLFHSPTSVDKVLATNAGTFFTRKSIQGVLRGGKDIAVVQFCEALHWRLLVLWGTERVAQYANPYGTALPRRHALARRVEGFHGWSTRSILLALQPEEDDYQCGIWDHILLACLFEYIRTADEPCSTGFEAFLATRPNFRPIPTLGTGTSEERGSAKRANVAHATEVRATLRSVLWQAAVSNALPYGLNAQVEHLGNTAAEGIDIDEEDRALDDEEDDDEDIGFVEETK
jgi:hypothetical protein